MAARLRIFAGPIRLLVLLGALIALLLPASAGANGGTSIATAPELPLGSQVFSSLAGLDYWAVEIEEGDELVIDFEAISSSLGLCFMRPEVTEYTLGDSDCWEPKETDAAYQGEKRQTKHVFGTAGRWTLIIGEGGAGLA